MINNKITLGFLIIFLILPIAVYAKPKQPTQQQLSADEIVAKMKFQLQLTDKQAEDVKPIIMDYLVQEQLLKSEEKKQLSKVLTGDQLFTWNFLENDKSHDKKKRK